MSIFFCFTHRSTHVWIYRDYCRCYTRHIWWHPVSFERYTLSLHAYVLPNAVPCSHPFLWCIHLNVSLLVGVRQHSLTKLALSRQLFHKARWFHALSTCIELQNMIVYRSSLVECAGSAYERRAMIYWTTFVSKNFWTKLLKKLRGAPKINPLDTPRHSLMLQSGFSGFHLLREHFAVLLVPIFSL